MAATIYITELGSGERLSLLAPESVKFKADSNFITYNIIGAGEVKIPNGEKLSKFSWKGRLPGKSMRNMGMVRGIEWRSPSEIQRLWNDWKTKGKKLRLLVTGTTINHDVYLDSYTVDTSKLDTVEYNITFSVAKDIIVRTTDELNITNTKGKNEDATTKPRASSSKSAEASKKKTYTVVYGDCPWSIAKKFLGNGARWQEIYNLNKSVIGSNPNVLRVGQKLTIP